MKNQILEDSKLAFGAPDFSKIKISDYKDAFNISISNAKKEIKAITDNKEKPSFENTIEALEKSGTDFEKVAGIFYNLNEADTSEEMQQIAEDINPLVTEYTTGILLNDKLFKRIKEVYSTERKNEENKCSILNIEQKRLLSETYKDFARNGALLAENDKAKYSEFVQKASLLSLKFSRNVLSATNDYYLEINNIEDIQGLPDFLLNMAKEEAIKKGKEGWVFTLDAPCYGPFLKYCQNRELRQRIWEAYNSRCINGKFDNTKIIKQIVNIRIQIANILGYRTYAEYALENRMAKKTSTVNKFLEDLLDKTLPHAKKDIEDVKLYAKSLGFKEDFMPWDLSFYSEKYRKAEFDLDDEETKPYFEINKVEKAIFDLAGKLYGLQFIENLTLPKYNPDIKIFEVYDTNQGSDKRFMSLLYMDYYPRKSKRGGAWMTNFREESIQNEKEERPFISVVTNFTKPNGDTPSLLTFREFTTLLHEFGHALHGILAEGHYSSLTGTNVARDFVELPSQFMENWAYEKEFMNTFAIHYKTGETIPDSLMDKIIAAKNFNAGYAFVRQLIFGISDMAWHTLTEPFNGDVVEFEHKCISRCKVLPLLDGMAFSPSFGHIFSNGYSAGYYSYKWAEVLEADAFAKFKEDGLFNKNTSTSFRKNILSRGNIEDAEILYRNFRGRDPQAEALLKQQGLI